MSCSETSDLPGDIVYKILLKLPAKDLGCFSCTCKLWCSSIKNPKFIKSHIDETSSHINRQKVLFISRVKTPSSSLQDNTLGFSIYSTEASLCVNSQVLCIEPPPAIFCYEAPFPSVSSCNGLLCMVYTHIILLCNPSMKKHKLIPKFNLCFDHLVLAPDGPDRYESTLHGFAYDSSTEDYKVAAFVVIDAKCCFYFVAIYSVNNQCWRNIETIPAGFQLLDRSPISVDGTINMIARPSAQGNGSAFEEFAIISLFLADEVFTVTAIPWKNGSSMKLSNFANRLCLSMFVEMEFMVCYLEKLEGENGWKWADNVMKFPIVDAYISDKCYSNDIICLKENGNILWKKVDGGFLEYNERKGEVTEFTLNRIPQTADISTFYFESLASPKIPWD